MAGTEPISAGVVLPLLNITAIDSRFTAGRPATASARAARVSARASSGVTCTPRTTETFRRSASPSGSRTNAPLAIPNA